MLRYRLMAFTTTFIIISFTCIFIFHRTLDAPCPFDINVVYQNMNSLKTKEEYFLIVMILSSPLNVLRRNVLRNTWLQSCKEVNVKYFFVVATKSLPKSNVDVIHSEHYHSKDLLIIEGLEDSYSDLTEKTLQAYILLNENAKYKYVLKCDDDSFVNVPELLKLLREYEGESRHLYLGFFNGHATVQKSGKWKENNWILCDFYLPYALGGGYVLSQELVNFIAKNAKDLELFASEDVSVGVWLASKANINRVHSPLFNTEYKSRGCSNSYIVSHKHTEVELEELHSNLKFTGKMCKKEYQTRKSYNYNWSGPPSKCCQRSDVFP